MQIAQPALPPAVPPLGRKNHEVERPRLLLADDSVTIQRVIELTFAGEDVKVLKKDSQGRGSEVEMEVKAPVIGEVRKFRRFANTGSLCNTSAGSNSSKTSCGTAER